MEQIDASKKNGGSPSSQDSSVKLQRRLGLFSGTALIVGSMIGSGIFISPKGVLEGTGSVALSLIVWAICGGISILGIWMFMHRSGGEYAYLLEGIGPVAAFLYSWASTFVLKPAVLAIICLSFAEYIVQPLWSGPEPGNDCEPPQSVLKLLGAAAIGEGFGPSSAIQKRLD